MVPELTDLHGGRLQVESELGRGIRSMIDFPWIRDVVVQQEIIESGSKLLTSAQAISQIWVWIKRLTHSVVLLAKENMASGLTLLTFWRIQVINSLSHNGLEATESFLQVGADEYLRRLVVLKQQTKVENGHAN